MYLACRATQNEIWEDHEASIEEDRHQGGGVLRRYLNPSGSRSGQRPHRESSISQILLIFRSSCSSFQYPGCISLKFCKSMLCPRCKVSLLCFVSHPLVTAFAERAFRLHDQLMSDLEKILFVGTFSKSLNSLTLLSQYATYLILFAHSFLDRISSGV